MHAQTETWRNAPRVHTAMTADLEKRILIWLAHRLPSRVNSDHLTARRVDEEVIPIDRFDRLCAGVLQRHFIAKGGARRVFLM